MFVPFYESQLYDDEKAIALRNRWLTDEGKELHKAVTHIILEGGSKHGFHELLGPYVESKFAANEQDLKGIDITELTVEFAKPGNNFHALDFSYSSFWHIHFTNATFWSTAFDFTQFYNCTFIDGWFARFSLYGCRLTNVTFKDCSFAESDIFNQCNLINVTFENCYIPEPMFSNCKFDGTTTFINIIDTPPNSESTLKTDNKQLSEIYRGIKDAYLAGKCSDNAREFYFREKRASTEFNQTKWYYKLRNLLFEWVTGYGVQPERVFFSLICTFFLFTVLFFFGTGNNINQALILSAGAFFTFGTKAETLTSLNPLWSLLYTLEAFSGILLNGLFITVLANFWFNWEN